MNDTAKSNRMLVGYATTAAVVELARASGMTTSWQQRRAMLGACLLALAMAMSACGSEPRTGAFIVDVESGNTTRIAGDGSVIWPATSPGPAVWNETSLRLFSATDNERQAIDLDQAAEGSLDLSADHYTYVAPRSDVVSLDAGNVILGSLEGGHPKPVLGLGRTPRFEADGDSLLATQVSGDPNIPNSDRFREQLIRIPVAGSSRPEQVRAPESTVQDVLPDGRLLLRTGPGRRNRIVLRERNGTTRTIVPNDSSRLIRLSNDGKHLLYVNSGGGIQTGPVANEEPKRTLRGNFPSAAWSADGTRIAATTFDGRVIVMQRDGTRQRVVAKFEDALLADVAWSGDGRRLIIDAEEPPAPST